MAGDRLLTAIAAGFGAMAIMRSKFFSLRTNSGEKISVGLDADLSALLNAANAGVDRSRASRRLRLVFDEVESVKYPDAGWDFLNVSLAAMQNLSNEEKRGLAEALANVQRQPYPAKLKLQAMCYGVLNLTGERVFSKLMFNLKRHAAKPPTTVVGEIPVPVDGAGGGGAGATH